MKKARAPSKKAATRDEDEGEVEDEEKANASIAFSYSDKGAETGFCAYYRALASDNENVLRFFERKGGGNAQQQQVYYTVHGEDAVFVATEYYGTLAALTYLGGGEGLASQSVSPSLFSKIVRDLLLNRRYRVEVYSSSGNQRQQNWTIIKKGSPGNVEDFEEHIYMDASSLMDDSSITMAIARGLKDAAHIIGVAFLDLADRTVFVCEFEDDSHLSNLESVIMQVGVKECLVEIDDEDVDSHRTLGLLEDCHVMATPKRKTDYNTKNLQQDLANLLIVSPMMHNYEEIQLHYAMQSAACLLRHFELLTDDHNFHKFRLKTYDLRQYMRLDKNSFRALNLFPDPALPGAASLFSVLNQCRTPMGSRRLLRLIKQPFLRCEHIIQRHDLVEIFCMDTALTHSLLDEHFKRMPDVTRLMRKFIRHTYATLQDVLRMYQFVEKLSDIQAALEAHDGDTASLLKTNFAEPLSEAIVCFGQFTAMVETMVDLSLIHQNEYRVRPDYDPDLAGIAESLGQVKASMESLRAEVAADLGMEAKEIHLQSNKQFGYFFRVTSKNQKYLRKRDDYRTVDNLRKDGIKFRNAELENLNKEFLQLNRQYDEKQAEIVDSIIQTTATYIEPAEKAADIVGELDCLASLAMVALNKNYVRPEILPGGSGITLRDSRHPVMEQDCPVPFIPNDAVLSRESRLLIITGPNMGGKSTYIRQVGLIAIMAQIGSFVPCSSASIGIVDAILARVGAGDSQQRGVSTFMAEMLDTAHILRCATPHSLVIIDELGRGTSTYDGFGLAWAISKHIATEIGAHCLFATHFHELTMLAEEIPGVANLHVTAHTGVESGHEATEEDDGKSLTFLYKLQDGPCDQSFGINVALITNFPADVVKLAKRKAVELEDFERPNRRDKEKPVATKRIRGEQATTNYASMLSVLQKFAHQPLSDGAINMDNLFGL